MSDDIDLDAGFDEDFNFDDLDMDPEVTTESRDPIVNVQRSFFSGAVTAATDTRAIEETIRDNVPTGYVAAADEVSKHLGQLDKAKKNLINPIRKDLVQLKSQANRLTPMVKNLVGERFGNKFDELTKGKSSSSSAGDADQQEMQSGLTDVFSAMRSNQLEDKEQELKDKLLDDKTDESRFHANYKLLSSLELSSQRSLDYTEQVTSKVQQKNLELGYRQFHILRNLLKVTTESGNATISELKAITKNSALPDIIKRRSNENLMALVQDDWQGRTAEKAVDFGKDYFQKFYTNLQDKATEASGQITDAMGGFGDAIESYADMQETMAEMGGGEKKSISEHLTNAAGQMGGKGAVGLVQKQMGKMLGSYLEGNPEAMANSENLRAIVQNLPEIFNSMVKERADDGNALFKFVEELLPKLERDREVIDNTLAAKSTLEAQWDKMSRESLVKIIPGWLSKIHYSIEQLLKGNRAEQETYDVFGEDFITLNQQTKQMLDTLVNQETRDNVTEAADSIIAEILRQEEGEVSLSDDGRKLLREQLLREANNELGFNPERLSKKESYYGEIAESNADAVQELTELFKTQFNTTQGTKLKYDTRSEGVRRSKTQRAFSDLATVNPEIQETINMLRRSGNYDVLERMGLAQRETDGHRKLKVDHDSLYTYKLNQQNSDVAEATRPPFDVANPAIGPPLNNSVLSPVMGAMPNANVAQMFDQPTNTTQVVSLLESERNNLLKSIEDAGYRPDLDEKLSAIELGLTTISDAVDSGTIMLTDALMQLVPTPVANDSSYDVDATMPLNVSVMNDVNLSDTFIDRLTDALQSTRVASQGNRNADLSYEDTIIENFRTSNETSNDIRSILTNMFTSQQANHGELMGRDSFRELIGNMGLSISNILKKPFSLLSGAFGKTKDFIKNQKDRVFGLGGSLLSGARSLVSGVGGEFISAFKSPDDIYLVGGATPVMLGKDIMDGRYYSVDVDGKVADKNIASISDIDDSTHQILDSRTSNIIVSNEELRNGLETRTKKPMEFVGGLLSKSILTPAKFVGKMFQKGKSLVGKMYDGIKGQSAKVSDVYDSEGNLRLTKHLLMNGGYSIRLPDGSFKVITDLQGLVGDVYNSRGDVVLTIEDIQTGIFDKTGTKIDLDKAVGLGKKLASGLWSGAKKLVKMPFDMLGGLLAKFKDGFKLKAIKNLVLSVDSDIIFKANVVNLYTDKLNTLTNKKDTADDVRESQTTTQPSSVDSGSDTSSSNQGDVLRRDGDNRTSANNKPDNETHPKTTQDAGKRNRGDTGSYVDSIKDKFTHAGYVAALMASKDVVKDKYSASEYSGIMSKLFKGNDEDKAEQAKTKSLNEWANLGKAKPIKGDTDGDGKRDGSWKDQLAKRKAANDKPTNVIAQRLADRKEKGSPNFFKQMLGMVGGLVGMLGNALGMGGMAAKLLGGASMLGTVTKTLGGKVIGSAATGGAGLMAKLGSKLPKAGVLKTVAKAGAKTIGKKLAVRGALAGGLALFGGAALAPAVALLGTAWAAYEIGTGLWGYFSRRSSMGRMEFLRHLSYGFIVGEDGDKEDKKVALRYFENEVIGMIDSNGATADVEMSAQELWEEYAGDFDQDSDDPEARDRWIEWYQFRFKPVLFKWIAQCSSFKTKDGDAVTLGALDDKLSDEDMYAFAQASIDYSSLKQNPLNIQSSPFATYSIDANLGVVKKYIEQVLSPKAKEDSKVVMKPSSSVADKVVPIAAAKVPNVLKQEARAVQAKKPVVKKFAQKTKNGVLGGAMLAAAAMPLAASTSMEPERPYVKPTTTTEVVSANSAAALEWSRQLATRNAVDTNDGHQFVPGNTSTLESRLKVYGNINPESISKIKALEEFYVKDRNNTTPEELLAKVNKALGGRDVDLDLDPERSQSLRNWIERIFKPTMNYTIKKLGTFDGKVRGVNSVSGDDYAKAIVAFNTRNQSEAFKLSTTKNKVWVSDKENYERNRKISGGNLVNSNAVAESDEEESSGLFGGLFDKVGSLFSSAEPEKSEEEKSEEEEQLAMVDKLSDLTKLADVRGNINQASTDDNFGSVPAQESSRALMSQRQSDYTNELLSKSAQIQEYQLSELQHLNKTMDKFVSSMSNPTMTMEQLLAQSSSETKEVVKTPPKPKPKDRRKISNEPLPINMQRKF